MVAVYTCPHCGTKAETDRPGQEFQTCWYCHRPFPDPPELHGFKEEEQCESK